MAAFTWVETLSDLMIALSYFRWALGCYGSSCHGGVMVLFALRLSLFWLYKLLCSVVCCVFLRRSLYIVHGTMALQFAVCAFRMWSFLLHLCCTRYKYLTKFLR